MSPSVTVPSSQSARWIPSRCELIELQTLDFEDDPHRTVVARSNVARSHHRPRKDRRRVGQMDARELPNILMEM
jgi:hypothetical protein